MAAIVIRSKSNENLKLIAALAAKMGEKVTQVEEELLEDFALGLMMKKAKTGKNVARATIMKKLRHIL